MANRTPAIKRAFACVGKGIRLGAVAARQADAKVLRQRGDHVERVLIVPVPDFETERAVRNAYERHGRPSPADKAKVDALIISLLPLARIEATDGKPGFTWVQTATTGDAIMAARRAITEAMGWPRWDRFRAADLHDKLELLLGRKPPRSV